MDGHVDMAWNALEFGRDPRLGARDTRLREQGSDLPSLVGVCTTGLPDWTAGGFGLIFASIFVLPEASAFPGYTKITYSTAEEAGQVGRQELDYYHAVASQGPSFRLVKTRQDLTALRARRQAGEQAIGLVLLMEGANPIREPEELPEWYDAGLRILGPAWHATRYAGGTGSPGPFTELGYKLLDEMAALNMILDLSHLSEQAFFQAVESYPGIMIASHSNPRRFVPGDRNLSDEMIRLVAGRGGVVGVSFYNAHLQQGWKPGDARPSLSRVAEVIDYIVQLTGNVGSVALGTDMDGGLGPDALPQEIDTAADVGKVGPLLGERGYSEADIRAILMGNWLRVLESGLPV